MNYEGKLYGKIGNRFVELKHTTKDLDYIAAAIENLPNIQAIEIEAIEKMKKLQSNDTEAALNIANDIIIETLQKIGFSGLANELSLIPQYWAMKAENSNKIMSILKGFDHIQFHGGYLVCQHCGESSNSPARAMNLKSHLYTISGFVANHESCEPPKEIQP